MIDDLGAFDSCKHFRHIEEKNLVIAEESSYNAIAKGADNVILIVGDREVEASKAQVEAYMTENLPTMLEVFGIDILDKHCASCELEVRIKE